MTSTERRWLALAVLCAVQFMTVLDVAIVNVALPSMQAELRLSQASLQWVVSAYALTYAGFLLLGGRAADLFGRRRAFLAGVALFAAGSLLAGLAWSDVTLIGARALQGIGAAAIAPAALSILMTTFPDGRDRNLALGVWGAVGGLGAAAGVLLGGLVTDLLGWEWIFLVNLPVAAVALALAPCVLRESRAPRAGGVDVAGAVLVTAGLSAAVLAITKAPELGWSSPAAVGLFAVAAALLGAFVIVELRAPHPLLPFSFLLRRAVGGANVVGLLHGMAPASMFLLLTLYMQQVLGYSALQTGAAYVVVAGTSIVWSTVASRLVTRIGVRPVLVTGRALLVAGLLSFTQVPVEGSYLRDLLPGLVIVGIGLPFAYVSVSVAALASLEPHEAGIGSALISTSQQIGGALGIAILSSVAVSRTEAAADGGAAAAPALVQGFHAAFWVGAGVAALAVLAALALVPDEEREERAAASVDALPAAA